ncbi:MAG: hypothetical protein PHF37_07605 [Phycisphaerae bacterium]|nr:hypothetical protein [Phycisphaerae bacterium]
MERPCGRVYPGRKIARNKGVVGIFGIETLYEYAKSVAMTEGKEELIRSISSYIQENGNDYSEWILGICQDQQEFFPLLRHADSRRWRYKCTGSPKIAREVMDYFVTEMGATCQTKYPKQSAEVIYLYKKIKQPAF